MFAVICGRMFTHVSLSANTFGLALDVHTALSTDTLECAKTRSFSVAFVRVYKPENGGVPDPNAKSNIYNALKAGLGVEIVVQPNVSFSSAKTAIQQFDDVKKDMLDNRISFGTVWLVVSLPKTWSNNTQANIDFINNFLQRARTAKHYVGIYTSWYDWHLITDSYSGIHANDTVMLWYWSTLGIGPEAASPQNFDDFRSFGGWQLASVKQFAIVGEVCGVTVNQNTFVNGTTDDSTMYARPAAPKSLNKYNKKIFSAIVGQNF